MINADLSIYRQRIAHSNAQNEHINRGTSASQDMHRRIYGKREDVIREN